jgi:hypothetical protein
MATTTNYLLEKPTVGGDTDTWGGKLNDNMDAIDAQMKVNADAVAALGNPVTIARGGTGSTTASDARTALGLGTAATQADTKYAHRANNLSDLNDKPAALANLGAAAASAVPAVVTTTVTLGGNFSGANNCVLEKIGRRVIMSIPITSYTSSVFNAISAPGFIPAAYRPAAGHAPVSVYAQVVGTFCFAIVFEAGSLQINHRLSDGSLSSQSSTLYPVVLSWLAAS